jgi:ABC-2 type transport system ATP-binding protein
MDAGNPSKLVYAHQLAMALGYVGLVNQNRVALTVGEPHVAIPALLQMLDSERMVLARLTTRQASLEDVFVHLTGRHLGDEETAPA